MIGLTSIAHLDIRTAVLSYQEVSLKVEPHMIKVITSGRTDIEEYFRLSGVFESEKLNHTPLLVFVTSEDIVTVRIVEKPSDLLSYPDDTPVMGQWRGEWHSDFFQFTVKQYRQFLESQLAPLKSARNVVKVVGPQGGFRYLSYEYMNDQGIVVHKTAHSKSEAQRLEAFFSEHRIPISIERVS